jgi:hypothetical protein
LLGWFKYAGFFTTSLINSAARLGIDLPLSVARVALPVGISFFTFHAISYVIDIGRGTLQPATLPEFATYMAFFPHLVAGPIVRGSELLPQLRMPPSTEHVDLVRAGRLILFGLVKKVVISSYLASALVDRAFTTPGELNSAQALFAMYGYAAQIYADFSGYTDIAIGVALLLGFRFPENFDAPYTAVSLQDFWRRWHMTLSRWLRDYLYIPLGGNRGSVARTYRNLALTMLLGGLWHGASWTFVVCVARCRARSGTVVDGTAPAPDVESAHPTVVAPSRHVPLRVHRLGVLPCRFLCDRANVPRSHRVGWMGWTRRARGVSPRACRGHRRPVRPAGCHGPHGSPCPEPAGGCAGDRHERGPRRSVDPRPRGRRPVHLLPLLNGPRPGEEAE